MKIAVKARTASASDAVEKNLLVEVCITICWTLQFGLESKIVIVDHYIFDSYCILFYYISYLSFLFIFCGQTYTFRKWFLIYFYFWSCFIRKKQMQNSIFQMNDGTLNICNTLFIHSSLGKQHTTLHIIIVVVYVLFIVCRYVKCTITEIGKNTHWQIYIFMLNMIFVVCNSKRMYVLIDT